MNAMSSETQTGAEIYIVYDPNVLSEVHAHISADPRFVCLVAYGDTVPTSAVPLLAHLPKIAVREDAKKQPLITTYGYNTTSVSFVDPRHKSYHGPSASVAHTRSLIFLRAHIGGPYFDIEKIWEEHCYYEFEVRSVTKTMDTMVVSTTSIHVIEVPLKFQISLM
jgi:carboxymethylenebutenolidase